jgi:hypothetical protein
MRAGGTAASGRLSVTEQFPSCTAPHTLYAAWPAWLDVRLCIFLFFVAFLFSISFSFPFLLLVRLKNIDFF